MLTEEDVKKGHFISTYDLLRRLPGITVTNNEVRYRFAPVMVLLDNVPEENFDFDLLDVDDIKDVFTLLPLLSVLFTGRLREMVP